MAVEILFENAAFLWFLVLIPLLVAVHLYSLRYARQKAMRFANFEALQKIVKSGEVIPGNYGLLAMRIITLVGFTLAAAGATVRYDTVTSAYDYVIAMDSSSSMLAQDFAPDRMRAATGAASDWVGTLPENSQVGVVEFSSQARVLEMLSGDLGLARQALSQIVPGKSGGTAICEALKASTNELARTQQPRAIVLVSDGQNNAGCLLGEGVEYAVKNNVTVFSIGVGSTRGGSIPGVEGNLFTLDEQDLRHAAEQTGGIYSRAENAGELSAAFSLLGGTAVKKENFPLPIPLMILSFVFVFIDWGLSVTRYRTIP